MFPQNITSEGRRDGQEAFPAQPDNVPAAHLEKRLLVDALQRELLDGPVQPDDHMFRGPLSWI